MSLDWNAEKVLGIDKILKDDNLAMMLETAVFTGLSIGMNSITKTNYKEWYRRVWTWEAVQGAARTSGKGKDIYFTEAEVYKLIGLKTNVEPWSRGKFTTNIKKTALRVAIAHRELTRGGKQPP